VHGSGYERIATPESPGAAGSIAAVKGTRRLVARDGDCIPLHLLVARANDHG
jgi:hypothetical protein